MNSFFNADLMDQLLNLADKLNNEIIVIAIDDAIIDDEKYLNPILEQIITLTKVAGKVIVVHGGIKDVQTLFNELNISFIYNPYERGIKEEHMKFVKLALRGQTSLKILNSISKRKGLAINFTGYDCNFLKAKSLRWSNQLVNNSNVEEIIDFGCFGEINYIDPSILISEEYAGVINLVTPLVDNGKGKTFFVDIVNMAITIASSVFANRVIIIKDSLVEFKKNEIAEIKSENINKFISQNIFSNKLSIQLKSISKNVDLFTESLCFIEGKEKDCILNNIFSLDENSVFVS